MVDTRKSFILGDHKANIRPVPKSRRGSTKRDIDTEMMVPSVYNKEGGIITEERKVIKGKGYGMREGSSVDIRSNGELQA